MSKAENRAIEKYPIEMYEEVGWRCIDKNASKREYFVEGYYQAAKDIKEELSELFREFMMDCINDNTDTHILHFVEVFNNKIKTIGNE